MLRLEAKVQRVEAVQSGHELVSVYAKLRADAEPPAMLAQKAHAGDRWIPARAIRLGLSLVSNDGIFRGAPGLHLETLPMNRIRDSACTRLVPAAASAAIAARPCVGTKRSRLAGPLDDD
jgi:hypothetical protein